MPLTQVPASMIATGGIPSLDGIKFPVTQVSSADVNTLDDYEEGTWTPNVYNSSSSSTFTGKVGYYRKVGSLVICWFCCDYGNSGTAGSPLVISGLPFAIGTFSLNPTWGSWGANGVSSPSTIIRSGGGTTMALSSGGGDVSSSVTFVTGGFSYFTN